MRATPKTIRGPSFLSSLFIPLSVGRVYYCTQLLLMYLISVHEHPQSHRHLIVTAFRREENALLAATPLVVCYLQNDPVFRHGLIGVEAEGSQMHA